MINYAKLRNMKLLYNMEEFFYTKIELLNFIFTLPFSKLDARLESNALIFSGDLPVDIQLVPFLLLSSVNELIPVKHNKSILSCIEGKRKIHGKILTNQSSLSHCKSKK